MSKKKAPDPFPVPPNVRLYMLKQHLEGEPWRVQNRLEWLHDPKRTVGVFLRADKLYIVTESQAESGVWLHEGPVSVLPATCSDDELAPVVREHLARSRGNLKVDTRQTDNALPHAAGVKSWSAFQRSAYAVSICRQKSLTITPYRREKGHCDFVPASTGEIVRPLDRTDVELCRAIRDGLEIAKRES